MQQYRAGASGGIPWWAILDEDGEVLITSNDPEGRNIGFHDRPAESAVGRR